MTSSRLTPIERICCTKVFPFGQMPPRSQLLRTCMSGMCGLKICTSAREVGARDTGIWVHGSLNALNGSGAEYTAAAAIDRRFSAYSSAIAAPFDHPVR